MTEKFETIDAETVKVVYEDIPSSKPDYQEIIINKKSEALNTKLYKNRYSLSRSEVLISPKLKTKKLDDKLYRPRSQKQSCLIKDFEKHKIRSIDFSSM